MTRLDGVDVIVDRLLDTGRVDVARDAIPGAFDTWRDTVSQAAQAAGIEIVVFEWTDVVALVDPEH